MTPSTGAGPGRRRVALVVALLALLTVLLTPRTGPVRGHDPSLQPAAAVGDPDRPLVIDTVPPVADFPVTLEDVTVRTGPDGRARFPAAGEGDLADRLTLNEAVLPVGGRDVKVTADRFYPSTTAPAIALNLSYRVSFRFADTEGTPIDPGSIGTITMKGITGEVVRLGAEESAWLQGSRVTKEPGGLLVKELQWSVQRVEVSGTNVVNASQQNFLPAVQQDLTVQLLFFDVTVHVRDALFGFSTASAVQLVFPDGTSHRYPLDDGRVALPPLPRGDYTLTIVGIGPEMPRPVAVSRDLPLELEFHSWLDIGTILGSLLALALAMAVVGRRRRREPGSTRHSPGAHRDADPDQRAQSTRAAEDGPAAEPAAGPAEPGRRGALTTTWRSARS